MVSFYMMYGRWIYMYDFCAYVQLVCDFRAYVQLVCMTFVHNVQQVRMTFVHNVQQVCMTFVHNVQQVCMTFVHSVQLVCMTFVHMYSWCVWPLCIMYSWCVWPLGIMYNRCIWPLCIVYSRWIWSMRWAGPSPQTWCWVQHFTFPQSVMSLLPSVWPICREKKYSNCFTVSFPVLNLFLWSFDWLKKKRFQSQIICCQFFVIVFLYTFL